MSKILISWYSYNNDFKFQHVGTESRRLDDQVNEKGPTFDVHRYFYEEEEYEKHVLLCSSNKQEEKKYFEFLVSELKKSFKKHKIEPRIVDINDPSNISEIFLKVNPLLMEYKDHEVEIFVNPGTPQMQIVWYLIKPNFKRNINLFQSRQIKDTKDHKKPEKIDSNIDTLFNPFVFDIANKISTRQALENEIYYPDTIKPIYSKAEQIANTKNNVSCLILGESGTGKENLARYIHDCSNLPKEKFKAVNCAAYSDELLRSELFGHEKGSFTDASSQKKGLFEIADGGTVFLDEIGDISKRMQVSLLRALEEKQIQRVGGIKDIRVNIRIIAATNRNLEELCENKEFRWDLYFRLAITTLELPPLRDWTVKEIINLIDHLNNNYFKEFTHQKNKLHFTNEVLEYLISYPFKGNIRELRNLILSLYTFCENEVKLSDLPERFLKNTTNPTSIKENEKEHIIKVLKAKKWIKTQAARELKIDRHTLDNKIKIYGIKKVNLFKVIFYRQYSLINNINHNS